MKKCYAIIGTWNFKPQDRGVHLYNFDPQNCTFSNPRNYDHHVNAGQQFFDSKQNRLYLVDEVDLRENSSSYGGFLLSYTLDHNKDQLVHLNERSTLMTKPSYVCVDDQSQYALVCAHSGRQHVTKVIRNENGSYRSQAVFDDAGVVLFKLTDQGLVDEIVDVIRYGSVSESPSDKHRQPHLHSIVQSPLSNLFYSCDKGLDKIYCYTIDAVNHLLIELQTIAMPKGYAPRYLAMHPTLPIFYENNENCDILYTFSYDLKDGSVRILSTLHMTDEISATLSPSDLKVTSDGKYLYASIRGIDQIITLSLDLETGIPKREQIIQSEAGPRGLCVTPDDRYLISANSGASSIHCYSITENGILTDTGIRYSIPNAANISIVEY